MNRKARRAAATQAKKQVAQQLKTKAGTETQAPQPVQQLLYNDFQVAVHYQKIATEVHDAIVESLNWATETEFPEERTSLEEDMVVARRTALDARMHTVECGFAFLDSINPVPPQPVQVLSDDGLSDE